MATTSATGGILTPSPPPPADDSALDAIIQSLISNVTGLGALVIPYPQPVPPKQPDFSVNWCAFTVRTAHPDDGPVIGFDSTALVGTYLDHETIEVLATFYGPGSKGVAAQLRDGLRIPQNIEGLAAYSMKFVRTGPIRQVPELVNQQWRRRQDMSIVFRRAVSRTYQTTSLLVGEVQLQDDTVVHDTIIVPPGSTVEP